MDKRFVGILIGLVIIFGGIFIFTSKDSNDSNGAQPTNHVVGQGKSGVKLVEYADYQCPVCEVYYPVVEQVKKAFKNQIYFQFRNLPLTQIHQNALAAARTAEAAGLQDKFWEMNSALYLPSNWPQWTKASDPTSLFNTYAEQLGLNVEQFKKDFASEKVNDMINADVAEFKKTGREMATPTFFIDGEAIDNNKLTDPATGEPSFKRFSAIITAQIAKNKKDQ